MGDSLWKITSFLSFIFLFFTALAGLVLSAVSLASDRPWHLDEHATLESISISGHSKYDSIEDWLEAVGDQKESVRFLLLALYRFSALLMGLLCVILLCIIFLASKNKPLITCVQLVTLMWLALLVTLRYLYIHHESSHVRLVTFLFAANLCGSITYAISEMARPARAGSRAAEDAEQASPVKPKAE
eukprot:Rmarinus@m.29577